ncbi:hypothetical protein HKX48_001012 [Thoreauomyces humboldtii]|nr:hypothetical protein HKX48_001012 [Thoreauomyces humboldtii]
MPAFSGFDARIIVNGQPLEEFGEEYEVDDRSHVQTVYVVAEENQKFQVVYTSPHNLDTYPTWRAPLICVNVYADGRPVSRNGLDSSMEVNLSGRWNGNLKGVSATGYRMLPGFYEGVPPPSHREAPDTGPKKRALLSHQIRVGIAEAIPARARLASIFDQIEQWGEPFLTVMFKYRSRALLEASSVIPFKPEPSPEQVSIKPERVRPMIKRPYDGTVIDLDNWTPEPIVKRTRTDDDNDFVALSRADYRALLRRARPSSPRTDQSSDEVLVIDD